MKTKKLTIPVPLLDHRGEPVVRRVKEGEPFKDTDGWIKTARHSYSESVFTIYVLAEVEVPVPDAPPVQPSLGAHVIADQVWNPTAMRNTNRDFALRIDAEHAELREAGAMLRPCYVRYGDPVSKASIIARMDAAVAHWTPGGGDGA